jgi:hypothetical protein
MSSTTCPSDEQLASFADHRLDADADRAVAEHLAVCPRCTDKVAEMFCEDYAREGEQWWSQYAGRQILSLLARLPESQIEELLELRQSPTAATSPPTIIKLPIFEPAGSAVRRLAAATGDGLSVQKLSQQAPAFDFELVQFGRQLRITAAATDEDPSYRNCLARLILAVSGKPLLSRIVLVEEGRCRCVLEPEELDRLASPQGPVTLRLEPLTAAESLVEAGEDAYIPILAKLLADEDPGIRCGAVQVLARIGTPKVRRLIEPLVQDGDPDVRAAAGKALRQWP